MGAARKHQYFILENEENVALRRPKSAWDNIHINVKEIG